MRSASRKPGAGITRFMLPAMGSTITPAIASPWATKAASIAAESLYGSTIVSLAIALGTPADEGWPNVKAPDPASHRYAPSPRVKKRGVPPTERNARTGELTPAGIVRSARAKSSSLRLTCEPPRLRPHWPIRPLRCPRRGRNSYRGAVTRAAGEGPRDAGIDGQCESSHEVEACRNDSRRRSREAEARRRSSRFLLRLRWRPWRGAFGEKRRDAVTSLLRRTDGGNVQGGARDYVSVDRSMGDAADP